MRRGQDLRACTRVTDGEESRAATLQGPGTGRATGMCV